MESHHHVQICYFRLSEIVHDFVDQICGYMNEQRMCFGIKYGEEREDSSTGEEEGGLEALEEQLKNLELEMW